MLADRSLQDAGVPAAEIEARRLQALESLDVLDSPREEAFDRISQLVRSIFGVRIALVSVIDAHRQWYKSCLGIDADEVQRSGTFCTLAIQLSKPLIIPDATKDPRVSSHPSVVDAPRIRFYAGVPLTSRDGMNVGTVCAIDTEPRSFSQGDQAILTDIAKLAMDMIELHRSATLDVLTGLLSRRGFRDESALALALALRHKHNLSSIVFDLDRFKSVNDTYGHPAGDRVLSQVARTALANVRQTDHVGRIGGEEFAIILPHTDSRGALAVAQKVRQAIEATPVVIHGVPVRVTASFGVAGMEAGVTDVDALLARADLSLYQAKARGRNCCVEFGAEPSRAPAAPRRRVLKAGLIAFNSRTSAIDCTVRSMGSDGAGLDVFSVVGIPDHFALTIRADAFKADCEIVSRTDRHLEVRFR